MIVPKAKAGDTVCFTTATGAEVIGRLGPTTDDTVEITRPVILQPVQDPNGGVSLQFVPFLRVAAEGAPVPFRRTGMITDPVTPEKEIVDSYMTATSSLVLPKTGLVT